MALLFLLNQKEPEIAVAEAKATALGEGWWRDSTAPVDGVLVIEGKASHLFGTSAALGLSHRVVRTLASCAIGNLRTTLSGMDWKTIVRDSSYCVRLTNRTQDHAFTENALANVIASAYGGKVDLADPGVVVDIVITSKDASVGVRLWEREEDFRSRRSHLLPAMHPSGMSPPIARALVNIACAQRIHDPFCGAGGLLIEAGLAGKRVSGADIEPEMIARARKNCAAFKLYPDLRVADATMWAPRVQAIVTDLPYGRNTRPVALSHLLGAFLTRVSSSTGRVVLGVPHPMPFPKEWKWAVRAHMTSYVHKSLTKHFYVLERA